MSTTRRLRGHLRSNVIGYVALFFALSGGVAWATHPGGANTISTGDIINDQVFTQDIADNNLTSQDIRNDTLGSGGLQAIDLRADSVGSSEIATNAVGSDEVAPDSLQQVDLANNVIASAEVADNTLTGDDINEGTLSAGEPFHEVGTAGEPEFNFGNGHCDWGPYGGGHQSAAFYKDSDRVYLKGLVDAVDTSVNGCDFSFAEDTFIFFLPPGYRPPARSVHVTLANDKVARINIDPDGAVRVEPAAAAEADYKTYTSLDGISFRIG